MIMDPHAHSLIPGLSVSVSISTVTFVLLSHKLPVSQANRRSSSALTDNIQRQEAAARTGVRHYVNTRQGFHFTTDIKSVRFNKKTPSPVFGIGQRMSYIKLAFSLKMLVRVVRELCPQNWSMMDVAGSDINTRGLSGRHMDQCQIIAISGTNTQHKTQQSLNCQ